MKNSKEIVMPEMVIGISSFPRIACVSLPTPVMYLILAGFKCVQLMPVFFKYVNEANGIVAPVSTKQWVFLSPIVTRIVFSCSEETNLTECLSDVLRLDTLLDTL